MAFTDSPKANQAAYVRQQEQKRRSCEDTTRRLIVAFLNEPDREWAEFHWGGLLQERGIDWRELGR